MCQQDLTLQHAVTDRIPEKLILQIVVANMCSHQGYSHDVLPDMHGSHASYNPYHWCVCVCYGGSFTYLCCMGFLHISFLSKPKQFPFTLWMEGNLPHGESLLVFFDVSPLLRRNSEASRLGGGNSFFSTWGDDPI